PESARKPAARERGLLWIGVLGGLFLLLGGFWLLVRDGVLELPGWSDNFAHRVPLAAAIVVGLLLAARLAEIYGISRVESPVSRGWSPRRSSSAARAPLSSGTSTRASSRSESSRSRPSQARRPRQDGAAARDLEAPERGPRQGDVPQEQHALTRDGPRSNAGI